MLEHYLKMTNDKQSVSGILLMPMLEALPLVANIRLGMKLLQGTNALTYYA
jgi:hypothetical protein